MKSFFSLIFIIFALKATALEAITIYSQTNKEEENLVIDVLTKRFSFPRSLIDIKRIPCERNKDSVILICLEKNAEIKILNLNEEFLRNNFLEFTALKESV